jgi:hypothetical protein
VKHATLIALTAAALALIAVSVVTAEEIRKCKACGEPIHSDYFETGGAFYHPRCFTCEYCKEPIKGSFTVFRKKNYHTSCFEEHVALRCAVCGGIIEGQYLLDYWGNAYHTRHKGSVIQCDFCQRFIVGPLADGMERLPDGRTLCAKCAPASVTSIKEARDILLDTVKKLGKRGISVEPASIELHLVGLEELRRIAGRSSRDTKGFTDCLVEKGPFGMVKNEDVKVYLLNGMPRAQMAATAAHELMHVWQFRNSKLRQDPALSEGSCNFASYLVLRRIGGQDADYVIDGMLTDPDPIYGEGFRRVKTYAEKNGIPAWLRLLKAKNPDLSKL